MTNYYKVAVYPNAKRPEITYRKRGTFPSRRLGICTEQYFFPFDDESEEPARMSALACKKIKSDLFGAYCVRVSIYHRTLPQNYRCASIGCDEAIL
jgi:hypothetical protein